MTDTVTMILGGKNEEMSGKKIFQAYINEQQRLYPGNFQMTFPLDDTEDNQVEVRVKFEGSKAVAIYGVTLLEFLPIARHEMEIGTLNDLADLVSTCQSAFNSIVSSEENVAEIKIKINSYIESKFSQVFDTPSPKGKGFLVHRFE